MPLTRDFHETVVERARVDSEFRAGLVEDAIQQFLDGEIAVARILLRDCINATIGFAGLSAATGTPIKSLMRMVGPKGNPTAVHFAAILRAVQQGAGVHARVEMEAA